MRMSGDEWLVRVLEEGIQDAALRTRNLADGIGLLEQQLEQSRNAPYSTKRCTVTVSGGAGTINGCVTGAGGLGSGVTLRIISDTIKGNVPGHIYADPVVNSDGSFGVTFDLLGADTSNNDWLTINPIIVPAGFALGWRSAPFYQSTTWGCGAPGNIPSPFFLASGTGYACSAACQVPLPTTLQLTDSYYGVTFNLTWTGSVWQATRVFNTAACAGAGYNCTAQTGVSVTYQVSPTATMPLRIVYGCFTDGFGNPNGCPRVTGITASWIKSYNATSITCPPSFSASYSFTPTAANDTHLYCGAASFTLTP